MTLKQTYSSLAQRLSFSFLATGLIIIFVAGLALSPRLIHNVYADGATGSLSFDTAGTNTTGNATVGSDITLNLYENCTTSVIGVTVELNFSTNLNFVSASTGSGNFTVAPPDSYNNTTGTASLTRGSYSAQSGTQLVTSITFKVIAAGTGTVSMVNNVSYTYIAPDSGSNINPTLSSASYSLSQPASSNPTPTSTPSSSAPTPATPSTSTTTTKSSSISVKPATSPTSATTQPVTVSNNSSVAVTTPVSVQPTTVQVQGVKSVQYYLNGQLVATETKAPYTYTVNTKKLKNGSYSLTTKTNYSNGTSKQSTQHLAVKNTSSHNSLVWLLILALLIIGGIGYSLWGPGSFAQAMLKRFLTQSHPKPLTDGPVIGPSESQGIVVSPDKHTYANYNPAGLTQGPNEDKPTNTETISQLEDRVRHSQDSK